MNTIFRNMFSILKRFRMATLLNVGGLSIAFAAFMLIQTQLRYDWNFGKSDADYQRILRLDILSDKGAMAVQFRPLADMFISSSPHIQAGTLITTTSPDGMTFSIEKEGARKNYQELMVKVYPNIGDVFTFNMIEGTLQSLSNPDNIILPQSIAQKIFEEESAIGKQLITANNTYVVGGVYKDFPKNALLQNIIYSPIPPDERLHDWNLGIYYTYVKLDDARNKDLLIDNFISGSDFSVASQALSWMGDIRLRLVPIKDIHFLTDAQFDFTPKTSKQTLFVLLTIAFVVLLIAGINFTNFSIALVPLRIKGINTRKVLGSNQRMIIYALLGEAVLIAGIAFVCSAGLIYLFSKTPFVSLFTADVALSANKDLLALTGAIALLTGIIAGIYPAFYSTSFEPALALKGNFGLSPKGKKLRNVLISTQFLASFVLIICSLFMYLQNRYMQTSSLGYDKENLIVTNIPNKLLLNKEAYTNRLQNIAGVETVAYLDFLLSGTDQYMQMTREVNSRKVTFAFLPVISHSFLDVVGLPVLEGRNFRIEDENNPDGTIMINETAQRRYNLTVGDKLDRNEIVAVIPDIKFASLRKEIEPMLFYLWGKNEPRPLPSSYAYIKVKPGVDMTTSIEQIRAVSEEFDGLFTFNVRLFNQVIGKLYDGEKQFNLLIILFGFIAVFLSITGVFGLVVYECEYRRKEIAIRKVLGSSLQEILLLFNTTYVRILTICFLISVPIAWYSVHLWLKNFAYKTPMHFWVYILSFLFILLITSLTVTFQSWRVANANPVDSIKAE